MLSGSQRRKKTRHLPRRTPFFFSCVPLSITPKVVFSICLFIISLLYSFYGCRKQDF